MNTTTMSTTPTAIVDRLIKARPDLNLRYGNTGGGVQCIVAYDPDDDERGIYIGTAAGNLGWSDSDGEAFGEWPDLVTDDGRFQNDDPLPSGEADIIFDRILAVLNQHLGTEALKVAEAAWVAITGDITPSELADLDGFGHTRDSDYGTTLQDITDANIYLIDGLETVGIIDDEDIAVASLDLTNDAAHIIDARIAAFTMDADDVEVAHAQTCEASPPHTADACPDAGW